jgi:hypothetical protein
VAVTWTKFDNFYTARFSKNNLKASMVLSESAEWHWTRWEIPTQYLPKKVREYVAANYAGFKTAGTLIEYKPGGEFYLVSLKKKKENPVLRFTIKTEFVGTEPPRTEEKKK